MILYVVLLLAIIIVMFWVASFILRNVEIVTITWGAWGSYKIESTNLLIALVLTFIALYFLIWLLKSLFGMRKNLHNYRQTRLVSRARQDLTQGLVLFTSGYWADAESLLLRNIAYAETPLLNYLAAARSAHMQENYNDRDQYLKKAAEKGESARVAVAVSQAEMQLGSKQVEQARASLVHLLELSPDHPYANKLLATVYYRQEDWKNLF
ncbi:MAG: heme biosynthesis protein HemY, partial [Cocleimonas sp.]|nr:heme biosynthesis protein HemY [Cocleimonas sp.]